MTSRKSTCEMAPACYCGNGKMVVKVAGPKSQNRNRPYYKCPDNRDDHYKHFIWCDEYHDRNVYGAPREYSCSQQYDLFARGETTDSSMANTVPVPAADFSRYNGSKFGAGIELQLAYTFMAVVLIMFGVLLGLILAKMM